MRVTLSSSVFLAIAIRAAMYSGRSSGGSSDRTAPPRLAGIDHEVDPPPPSPTYGGYLDFAVSQLDFGPRLALDRPTSKAIAYVEWETPIHVVWAE